jgi:hypothetical protein
MHAVVATREASSVERMKSRDRSVGGHRVTRGRSVGGALEDRASARNGFSVANHLRVPPQSRIPLLWPPPALRSMQPPANRGDRGWRAWLRALWLGAGGFVGGPA